ncbi:MAG TPA: hypothetical protein VFL85_00660 [Candidatus Saccharimonadales bacterium]|nr:hypothetical protein [Candidatus Saccharimonadales bacterium]
MKHGNKPVKYSGLLQFEGQSIPYHYWAVAGRSPDTLLLLGAAQTGRIAKWVAATAGPGVVVAEGVPHWHIGTDPDQLLRLVDTYAQAVLQAAIETFEVRSLNLMAESQVTPGAVRLAYASPEQIRNIALILPMGLTVEQLGDTKEARLREFKRRMLQTMRQKYNSPLRRPRYAYLWLTAVWLGVRYHKTTNQQFATGVSFDITQALQQVACGQAARGASLHILLGKYDILFPAHEIQTALKKAHLHTVPVTVVDTGHTSLATRAGKRTLDIALRLVRTSLH